MRCGLNADAGRDRIARRRQTAARSPRDDRQPGLPIAIDPAARQATTLCPAASPAAQRYSIVAREKPIALLAFSSPCAAYASRTSDTLAPLSCASFATARSSGATRLIDTGMQRAERVASAEHQRKNHSRVPPSRRNPRSRCP